MICLEPGLRKGRLRLPQSKSHAHRVLIADFLAGGTAYRETDPLDCDDIVATKRCLDCIGRVLTAGGVTDRRDSAVRGGADGTIRLSVGESGTTRRLLGPVVAALGLKPEWQMEGRLASRPQIEYAELKPGVHELPGDVSSQFVSGLLLALPIAVDAAAPPRLKSLSATSSSEIRLSSPLASRGYVDMTLDVLKTYGICVTETATGFLVPAGKYVLPPDGVRIESDWSGAAFPLALNALGNEIEFPTEGLSAESRQPDRVVVGMLGRMTLSDSAEAGMPPPREEGVQMGSAEAGMPPPREEGAQMMGRRHSCLREEGTRPPLSLDVDACPDLFPVLAVVAAAQPRVTRFTGIRRLRLKESDRVAAMADVLTRFGVAAEVADDAFVVHGAAARTGRALTPGVPALFKGGTFTSYADHRIAMAIAVGATRASAPVVIDNETCAAKSYPTFFGDFGKLGL